MEMINLTKKGLLWQGKFFSLKLNVTFVVAVFDGLLRCIILFVVDLQDIDDRTVVKGRKLSTKCSNIKQNISDILDVSRV